MKEIVNLLFALFLILSPFFNGLYFENQFIQATFVLLLIFLFQYIEKFLRKDCPKKRENKKVNNENINLKIKSFYIIFLLIIIDILLTRFVCENYYNIYSEYKFLLYGLFQIFEMIAFYFVCLQVLNDKSKTNKNEDENELANKKNKVKCEKFIFPFLNDLNKNVYKIVIISGTLISLLSFNKSIFENITFYRENRFEGPFQYANSMAIYLFICFALAYNEKMNKKLKIITMTILTIAIILTNSRITYVIYILFLLIMSINKLFKKKKTVNVHFSNNNSKFDDKSFSIINDKIHIKKNNVENCNNKKNISVSKNNDTLKKYLCYALIVLTILLIGTLYVFNNANIKNRFNFETIQKDVKLKLSYYAEAGEIIKKYPFGLGYEGYFNIQNIKVNEQGTKYRLRLVHNFLYQWALNYGVIMLVLGLLLIAMYIYYCIKKKRLFTIENLIITLVLIHSMQDINLSFLTIDNLLILLASKNLYFKD